MCVWFCRFLVEKASLGNHSAQSPTSVYMASPGHAMGYYTVKFTFCSVQHVLWSLHWVLWQGLGGGGGLSGLRLCRFLVLFCGGGAARQPQCTEPCQCVCGEPWVFCGALQGQMQHLYQAQGVVEPALDAAAGLGRGVAGVCVVLPLSS